MPSGIVRYWLLKFNYSANCLEGFLKSVSFVRQRTFLDCCRGGVYEFLCFLQAESCSFSDSLDNLDLFLSDLLQYDVEVALLFLFSCCCTACCRCCYCYCAYAEFFLKSLNELVDLKSCSSEPQ